MNRKVLTVMTLLMAGVIAGCASSDAPEISSSSSKSLKTVESEATVAPSNEDEASAGEATTLLDDFLEANSSIDKANVTNSYEKDFDVDGTDELFVFVKESEDKDIGTCTGILYFYKDGETKTVSESKDNAWYAGMQLLDFGDEAYVYLNEYYVTELVSHVWGVENGQPVEATFSRLGQIIDVNNKDFKITKGAYDLTEEDGTVGMMMGHTWKPYYFFFDTATKSVKEYGAAKVDIDKLDDVFGEDIWEKIGVFKGEMLEAMYRSNGILTINTAVHENGSTTYGNINYDCKNKCFVDARIVDATDDSTPAEKSNYGGTYMPCLDPTLAVCPTEDEADFLSDGGEDPLAEYGLYVCWTKDRASDLSDYEIVEHATGDWTVGVLYIATEPIEDMSILDIEFVDCDDEGNETYNITGETKYGTIAPEMPISVMIEMVGDIPNNGFSFKDNTGKTRYFSISESGKDGSIVINEFDVH